MSVHAQLPHMHTPRGDAAVKRTKQLVEPNIVETYKIGNATIQIADNFVRTDPAKIECILDDMHRAAWKIVQSCRERGEDI